MRAREQAAGETVDHRCDLFSLGCVLYRMATGELPFQGANVRATLRAVETEQPRPAHEVNGEVLAEDKESGMRVKTTDFQLSRGGRQTFSAQVLRADKPELAFQSLFNGVPKDELYPSMCGGLGREGTAPKVNAAERVAAARVESGTVTSGAGANGATGI